MKVKPSALQVAALYLFWSLTAVGADLHIPLFEDPHETIDIHLRADFSLLNSPDQSGGAGTPTLSDPKLYQTAGTVSYEEKNARTVVLEARFQPRGKYRRKNCKHKPLEIRFNQSDLEGTVFENADKEIKTVRFCHNSSEQKQIIKEFLLYRTLNALGSTSFLVKLARFHIEDTSGTYPEEIQYGFFIESEEDLAERWQIGEFELTEAEEAVPVSQSELNDNLIVTYRSWYGDYTANKYVYRIRLSKKYEKQLHLHPEQFRRSFLQFFSQVVVPLSDHGVHGLRNYTPFEFNDQTVHLIPRDFDFCNWQKPLSSSEQLARSFFQAYFDVNGGTLEKFLKEPELKKKAVVEEVLAAGREILSTYTQSGILKHVETASPSAAVDIAGHLLLLEDMLENPEAAFAFLF